LKTNRESLKEHWYYIGQDGNACGSWQVCGVVSWKEFFREICSFSRPTVLWQAETFPFTVNSQPYLSHILRSNPFVSDAECSKVGEPMYLPFRREFLPACDAHVCQEQVSLPCVPSNLKLGPEIRLCLDLYPIHSSHPYGFYSSSAKVGSLFLIEEPLIVIQSVRHFELL
jgi:hypothetical protein